MKKEKKLKQLSPKIQRQIEILSKYYEIDVEKRIITLELVFDKVSEMFDDNVVSTKVIKFKSEILQRVSEIMDTFPLEFKIDLRFKIDDFEGYKPDEIIESFKDSLEMFHYSIHKEKNSRLFEAVVLALVSVGILFGRQVLLSQGFLQDNGLVAEMLDITAWVFLWQGVTILFLTPNELRNISFKILTRLDLVSMYEKDKLVFQVSQDQLQQNWIQVSRAEILSKRTIIVAGAFTFAAGVISFSKGVITFVTSEFSIISLVAFLFASLASGIVSILGGLGAISVYRDKGPFQKLVPFCAYFYIVVDVLLIALIVYMAVELGSLALIVPLLATFAAFLISSILYFVSYQIIRHLKKVNAKRNA